MIELASASRVNASNRRDGYLTGSRTHSPATCRTFAGMSLRERTADEEQFDGSGSHMLVFAAIVTDVARSTDEINWRKR